MDTAHDTTQQRQSSMPRSSSLGSRAGAIVHGRNYEVGRGDRAEGGDDISETYQRNTERSLDSYVANLAPPSPAVIARSSKKSRKSASSPKNSEKTPTYDSLSESPSPCPSRNNSEGEDTLSSPDERRRVSRSPTKRSSSTGRKKDRFRKTLSAGSKSTPLQERYTYNLLFALVYRCSRVKPPLTPSTNCRALNSYFEFNRKSTGPRRPSVPAISTALSSYSSSLASPTDGVSSMSIQVVLLY